MLHTQKGLASYDIIWCHMTKSPSYDEIWGHNSFFSIIWCTPAIIRCHMTLPSFRSSLLSEKNQTNFLQPPRKLEQAWLADIKFFVSEPWVTNLKCSFFTTQALLKGALVQDRGFAEGRDCAGPGLCSRGGLEGALAQRFFLLTSVHPSSSGSSLPLLSPLREHLQDLQLSTQQHMKGRRPFTFIFFSSGFPLPGASSSVACPENSGCQIKNKPPPPSPCELV